MHKYLDKLRAQGKTVYLCGDYNIAHREIDLRNPKSNVKNAGFLPEERAWMDQFLQKGWVDAFRHFCPDPFHYTWWSYRPGVREKNIGWRIDYFTTNAESKDRMDDAKHLPDVHGSDHCPVVLDVKR
jgi:exodeoxyribonuclease-3